MFTGTSLHRSGGCGRTCLISCGIGALSRDRQPDDGALAAIGAREASLSCFRSFLLNQLFEVAAHFHACRGADESGMDELRRRFELVCQVFNPVNAQKHSQIIYLVRNPLQVFQFVHGAGPPAD
jgi:hypothetical protein